MRVKIHGPYCDVTGYGYITKNLDNTLNEMGIETGLKAINWVFGSVSSKKITKKERYVKENHWNAHIYICMPSLFNSMGDSLYMGFTMTEVDGISSKWVSKCNEMDIILTPSEFCRNVFISSKVKAEKIRVIPLGVKNSFSAEGKKLNLPVTKNKFVFLSVGEWIPRKGFDLLVKAFVREFSQDDDVILILRTHSNTAYDENGTNIYRDIKVWLEDEKKKRQPPIYVLPTIISEQEMPCLYRMADCYVLPTRGEGWNMTAFEALSCRIPVITTNWSGHMDYLSDKNSFLINNKGLVKVSADDSISDRVYHGFRWAEPDVENLSDLMRYVYENKNEANIKAYYGERMVKEQLTWHNCAKKLLKWVKI